MINLQAQAAAHGGRKAAAHGGSSTPRSHHLQKEGPKAGTTILQNHHTGARAASARQPGSPPARASKPVEQSRHGTAGARLSAADSGKIPEYPRAWFYPQLPWGAPITTFPPERLRGQTAMLVWEIFTLVPILYVGFEIPYR